MSSPFGPVIRHNLKIAEALARSGVKGGLIPQFQTSVQPVIVMADMSQSYSGEPLEGRGIAGGRYLVVANPLRYSWFRFESLAPGGAVAEIFTFAGPNHGGSFIDVIPTESVPAAAIELSIPTLQCGGAVAPSICFRGETEALPSGTGPIDLSFILNLSQVERFYIPNGSCLCGWSEQTANGFDIFSTIRIQWRDIPSPIGLP